MRGFERGGELSTLQCHKPCRRRAARTVNGADDPRARAGRSCVSLAHTVAAEGNRLRTKINLALMELAAVGAGNQCATWKLRARKALSS